MRRIIGSYHCDRRHGLRPATQPGLAAAILLVIDTNVWLDLLVFDEPSVRRLEAVLVEGAGCLASAAMRAELGAVLLRSRFALAPDAQERALTAFDERVRLVAEAPDCRLACSDPDDRKFLDVAIAHGAHWLLSRDKALLRARRHALRRFGLRIGTPDEFLGWLDTPTDTPADTPADAPGPGAAPRPTGADRAAEQP
jgi:putative PIN family toxin of toxin-antitoxin system